MSNPSSEESSTISPSQQAKFAEELFPGYVELAMTSDGQHLDPCHGERLEEEPETTINSEGDKHGSMHMQGFSASPVYSGQEDREWDDPFASCDESSGSPMAWLESSLSGESSDFDMYTDSDSDESSSTDEDSYCSDSASSTQPPAIKSMPIEGHSTASIQGALAAAANAFKSANEPTKSVRQEWEKGTYGRRSKGDYTLRSQAQPNGKPHVDTKRKNKKKTGGKPEINPSSVSRYHFRAR